MTGLFKNELYIVIGIVWSLSLFACQPVEKSNAESDENKEPIATEKKELKETDAEKQDDEKKKLIEVVGPFEIHPEEPCDHCLQRICTKINGENLIEACENGEEAELCKALVACSDQTKCSLDKSAHCYCGKDKSVTECLSGGNGPCKAEVEAAAKSTDASVIATRYADPEYPVGRAISLMQCKKTYCLQCNK